MDFNNARINSYTDLAEQLLKQKGKRILAISAIGGGLLLGASPQGLQAQAHYEEPIPYPGELSPASFPFMLQTEFHDVDNDGDLDMLGTVYDTSYYYFDDILFIENTGNQTEPEFSNPKLIQTESPAIYHGFLTYGDLDGDGDLDALHNTFFYSYDTTGFPYERRFIFHENESKDSLSFKSPSINPNGLDKYNSKSALSFTKLIDVDNDADLDMLMLEFQYVEEYLSPKLIYMENTGSVDSFEFINPVEIQTPINDLMGGFLPAFADLDEDGDIDVLGVFYDYLNYQIYYTYTENKAQNGGLQFDTIISNPFNLDSVTNAGDIGEDPSFVDFDQDGDLDIFATKSEEPKARLYLNSLTSSIKKLQLSDIGINTYPNPVNDLLYLKTAHPLHGKVKIMTNTGRQLIEQKLQHPQTRINVGHLQSGVYFLHIQTKVFEGSTPIVIEH